MNNQRNYLSPADFVSSVKLRQQRELLEPAAQDEDREEEISGAQFLCETVIRSLTLEEAPDHRPLRRSQQNTRKANGEFHLPSFRVHMSQRSERRKLTFHTQIFHTQ